jgi:signal transduction histidine kinase
LTRALEQQRELDKLKNEFIQNVSHELRTPLSIIRGYAELLDAGELGPLSEEQCVAVDVITRRSLMLSKMLDDLLTILSAETGKMDHTPVDLAGLVRISLIDFEVQVKKAGLTLRSHIELPIAPVLGDAAHLRRVLDNLLSNAMKFTEPGGEVSVALYQVGSEVIVEVADTGIGIAPENMEHLFERFYQVDGSMTRRYGGVGLGLALVKEIAAAHGGSVRVHSTLGEGTQFRISLPAMPGILVASVSGAV